MKFNWGKAITTMKQWLAALLQGRRRAELREAAEGSGRGIGKLAAGAVNGARSMRFENPAKSVGMKLFLVFFVSILAFVIAVGGISYSISRSVLQEKVSEASKQAMIQAGQKLDFQFSSFENLSLQIMLDKDLQTQLLQLIALPKGSYEALDMTRKIADKINVYMYSEKNVKSLNLMTANGDYINISGSSMNGDNFKNTDWFKRIEEGGGKAVWLESQPKGISGTLSSPGFALGRTLRDTTSNQVTAVLLLEFQTDVLGKQLSQLTLGEGSLVNMVTASNINVYTEKPDQIGKKAAIELKKEDLEKDDGAFDKDGYQVVFYKSPVTSWFITGSIPVNVLTSSANKIRSWTIGLALLAAVAAVVIGYFVSGMIRRPLNKLRDLMDQGAKGNLRVRAAFKSRDEMGQLGNSFDLMMEQITSLVEKTRLSAEQVMETASELTNASRTTAISAKEIAVATEEISTGASGLATESERGNELTHQIGDRMKNVIQANLEMGNAASDVQSSSELGTKYMFELSTKTNDAETMIRSMVEKVDKLKESTRSIRKILDVLNNMTKQTNILSLNATIEAARAGAAGKGFMVVADEIRKLADQSRQSIGVVGEITETIQREIDQTVSVLSNAYPIFQQQISSVKEADTIFKQVRTHMGDFIMQLSNVSDSISELDHSQAVLSEAMTNVSAVAQESLATSEQVSSLSQEQLNISQGLVRLVEQLENLSNSLRDSLTRFQI